MKPRAALAVAASLILSPKFAHAQAASSASFWFVPGVAITKFETTMIVPALSSGSGVHGAWPGIENADGNFVYQSVISDSKQAGSWEFWVEYCCNPNYEATAIAVQPGDSITSTFTLGSNGYWTDAWSVSGSTSQSGSTANSFTTEGTINTAILAIELQGGASWDFGPVEFTSVSITASTPSNWCGSGFATSGTINYGVSGTSFSSSGSSATCDYSSLTLSS